MQIGVYNHANADWREETDKNLYGAVLEDSVLDYFFN